MTDKTLNVVPIGVPNLADIPAMLEHTAGRIRKDEIEAPAQAVLVLLVGDVGERRVRVFDFGGGDGTMLTALGMLTAAQYRLLRAINQ
jgi:hypothetical protein